MLDPQELRDLVDPLVDLAARHALALEWKADVATDVHVRIEREQLEHEADVALGRALERHVVAVEQNLARRWQLEPRDHPQRRRLAAAGWPQEHEELAVRDCERRLAHRDEIAEALLQVVQSYFGHWRYSGKWLVTRKPTVPAMITANDHV